MPLKGNKRGRPKKEEKFEPRRILTFFYEVFDDGEIRWWRNDNPGDMFDIIDAEELKARIRSAEFINVRVVDHLPGFCSALNLCPDHLGYH